jgi:hypothetical protein
MIMKKSRSLRKIILTSICVCLFVFAGLFLYQRKFAEQYPEVNVLVQREMDFGELSVFFTKLAQSKGAPYAYEILRRATFSQRIDMHLLGHVIGDELYKQEGIEGMSACTQDFRNACSHSIVVGYYLTHAEAGLADIAQACRRAPGGSGAYTMCFHGLGHGVLAATGYDFPRTVALCQHNGTPAYMFRESSECVGGAVMEIISGGFHDKAKWEIASKQYLSLYDPLLPCMAVYMPESSRALCLEYLTPHLVTVAGQSFDLGIPPDDVLIRAFGYCKQIQDTYQRSACFQGFGKEFIVMAGGNDIRSLPSMTNEQMQHVFALCALAGETEGEVACLMHALDSLYWGGENAADASIRFCAIMSSEMMKDRCFTHLIGAMKFFVRDAGQRQDFCDQLPRERHAMCAHML